MRSSLDIGSASSFQPGRRRSILPSGNTLKPYPSNDADTNGNDENSLFRRASWAANSFKRVSRAFQNEGPTKSFLRAALGDPNRPKYMQLAVESDELHAEWKRLRGYLQEFLDEYETCKHAMIDPYRRYRRLQSMMKKLLLHLKITDATGPHSSSVAERESFYEKGQVLQNSVRDRERRQKHELECDSFTTEQLAKETDRLKEKNEKLQNKIDLIINDINDLGEAYQSRKRTPLIFRYYVLRQATKTFLHSNAFEA